MFGEQLWSYWLRRLRRAPRMLEASEGLEARRPENSGGNRNWQPTGKPVGAKEALSINCLEEENGSESR